LHWYFADGYCCLSYGDAFPFFLSTFALSLFCVLQYISGCDTYSFFIYVINYLSVELSMIHLYLPLDVDYRIHIRCPMATSAPPLESPLLIPHIDNRIARLGKYHGHVQTRLQVHRTKRGCVMRGHRVGNSDTK